MACVDKMQVNVDSEMEEGEIVDELDDLSDISSEEEFLLRQRLEVLENYNNVLERKKAKRTSFESGVRHSHGVLLDLSDVSATEDDSLYKPKPKHERYKPKRRKELDQNNDNSFKRKKEHRKRVSRPKKKLGVKVVSESSEESEDEYRNKRKRLADAVVVYRDKEKTDTTSLSARLKKMLNTDIFTPVIDTDPKSDKTHTNIDLLPEKINNLNDKMHVSMNLGDIIDISTDSDAKATILPDIDVVDGVKHTQSNKSSDKDSDEDLELLRQHALNTKTAKSKAQNLQPEHKTLSEDEDSDTAELRLICLKSALLKKAIEMKQKQKLQKKLSQSTTIDDDLFDDSLFSKKVDSDNNTDIESVDMEIGSDADDKLKDCNDEHKTNEAAKSVKDTAIANANNPTKEEELEEDEDLLRAKLLTSLSKNLPNLVSPEIMKTIDDEKSNDSNLQIKPTAKVREEKRFIIKLDESDSEGEHEATENLTKMHMKLSEQIDFQQKLDLFLKSTRMEVEKAKLPDVVQQKPINKPQKFVAKAVNNLPKSEQIEYKNLVRRMAELEKIKNSRQAAMNLSNQSAPVKDTLKPRNVTIESANIINNLEEQITLSRKKIAEESAKMLKLKEEATKLSQKYKIAATELRNISTAITLNKRHQRNVQNCLSKIRLQHQSLLRSSTNSLHSKTNGRVPNLSYISNKSLTNNNKLQKENNPKDDYKNPISQMSVKISVNNNVKSDATNRLSVQVDVANNKKVVKVSKPVDERRITVDEPIKKDAIECYKEINGPSIEDSNERVTDVKMLSEYAMNQRHLPTDDYKSPLDALGTNTWKADPNAILCPFEVGGQCKDPDCKYLHTQTTQ